VTRAPGPNELAKAEPAWRLLAHEIVNPLPADWRAQLAVRLGQRPRRLGAWVELALFGARRCLDAAGEDVLAHGALLRVASLSGPRSATATVADQVRHGLPLPVAFMQSQPGQMLAALSLHLGWRGDASFVACRDRAMLLRLVQAESGAAGLLIGWVEEGEGCEWWRMVPDPAPVAKGVQQTTPPRA
jgi:hypothetical protein